MIAAATSWAVSGLEIDLDQGVITGVLNVTPDSFSDGGTYFEPAAAIAHGLDMVAAGARIVDVGGESTRPGASPVRADEEIRRVLPVVQGLAERDVVVSIDTCKPDVAVAALDAGASVINDVTGFADPEMIGVATDSDCGVVIMHGRESPLNVLPAGADAVAEVESFLMTKAGEMEDAGVGSGRIAVDPGIGFDKRPEQSLALLSAIGRLADHERPVMIGTSRKGFLRRLLGVDDWGRRDDATAVTTALGYLQGARLFRVHDVAKSRDALTVAAAIVAGEQWDEWLQG